MAGDFLKKLRNNIGKKNEKNSLQNLAGVHISDSPYSGVGHSDRLLICGDYVPTGIPAWETIKNNKEEIKMISKEKKTANENQQARPTNSRSQS